MQHCDTIINAGLVLASGADGKALKNASLAIASGRIRALAETGAIHANWAADQVLDLPDCLLMPGLVNAHTHAAMTFLRGLGDDLPLIDWLLKCVFPVEARLNKRIVYLGSLLGYAEMLASGICACVDMYIFEESVLQAANLAGIRCMGGEAVFNFPSAACGNYRDALARTRELAEHYRGSERIRLAVNPHSVYTTTGEILRDCRDMAQKLNIPLHIHLAESPEESRKSLAMHDARPVAWCEKNGLFDCRTIAAHVVDVNDEELELLAAKGVCVAHNPSSNMKLASGIAPVSKMLDLGMTVALGTDGAASNNNLNIFREMTQAALLQKLAGANPEALPAPVALNMATRNGSLLFGETECGKLAPGMKADCVALDMTLPNMQPMFNPVSQLVYAASGHECRMTMVDGEVLYKDGQFTRFNYQDLLDECAELREFALQRG